MAERNSFNENRSLIYGSSLQGFLYIHTLRWLLRQTVVDCSCGRCDVAIASAVSRTLGGQHVLSKPDPQRVLKKHIHESPGQSKKLVICQVLIFQQNKTSFGGGRGWGGFNKRLAIFVHEHVLKPLHLVGHIWLCPFSLKFLKQGIKQIKCPWRALCWPKRPFKGQRWRHRSWLLGEIWREKYFPNWGSLFR